jgi:hypothetical protein
MTTPDLRAAVEVQAARESGMTTGTDVRKADVNLAAQLGPMRPPQAQHVQPPPDGNVIDIGRKRRRVRVHGEVAR